MSILNGNFEEGPEPGDGIRNNAGNTRIVGWTVGGDGIDYLGTFWQPGRVRWHDAPYPAFNTRKDTSRQFIPHFGPSESVFCGPDRVVMRVSRNKSSAKDIQATTIPT